MQKFSHQGILIGALALTCLGASVGATFAETVDEGRRTCSSLKGDFTVEYTGAFSCVIDEGYARNCNSAGSCQWVNLRNGPGGPDGGTNKDLPKDLQPGAVGRVPTTATPGHGATAGTNAGGTIVHDHRNGSVAIPSAPPAAAAAGTPQPGNYSGTVVRDHRPGGNATNHAGR